MDLIKITHENLEQEHICCAISNNKDIQVLTKKNWLKNRLDEGLVFLKGNVRGKCFIEYIPAEYAWAPIDAPNYMYINCLWISGQFKGHGYSNLLLEECIKDSKEKGKKGLAVLSSKKKLGFLSDSKYMKYKGFITVDTAEPYFELMYLPFEKNAEKPKFRNCVNCQITEKQGFVIYYSDACPFTAKYVPVLCKLAEEYGAKNTAEHIISGEQARNNPSPFTNFSLYYNGEFITHEIQSEAKFEKILIQKGFCRK